MASKLLQSMRSAFAMTKQRCYNSKCRDYPHYGGRGLTIEQRWLDSFDNFIADMGLRPEGMTLERIDNEQGYSKANCVWATRRTQASNTRANTKLTWEGITDTVAGWARRTGIKRETLKARVKAGYSVVDVFTKEVKCGGLLPGKTYPPRAAPKPKPAYRGLAHPNTKLSLSAVQQMRTLKDVSFSELGRRFGVSVSTASDAVQAKGAYQNV